MRFIVMHRTSAHWEAGAAPTPELVARVGGLIGDLQKAGILFAAEGLRPSAQGARLRVGGGAATVTPGPYDGGSGVPAGFTILRTRSLDEAVGWAARLAEAAGAEEIDVRPVTEAWDIGLAPPPAGVETRRYILLRKATAATEQGAAPTPSQRAAVERLVGDAERESVHVSTVGLRPSARGRRYKNSRDGVRFVDGPFAESKELIGGFVILGAASLDAAHPWALRYVEVVGADEVDLRELE